jgi:hypothetical protein
MAGGKVTLTAGQPFRLDLDPAEGDATRAGLPHPEIFAALEAGTELLLDDGKLRLRVDRFGPDFADTTVLVGGPLSDRKGVNVPGVLLPISPSPPRTAPTWPSAWRWGGLVACPSCSARGHPRGARADRRPGLDHGQAREARRHRAPGRHRGLPTG